MVDRRNMRDRREGFRFAQGMALFDGTGPSTALRSAQDDRLFMSEVAPLVKVILAPANNSPFSKVRSYRHELRQTHLRCWYIVAFFWLINAFTNKRTIQRQNFASRMQYVVLFWLAFWLLFGSTSHRSHHLGLVVVPHSAAVSLVGLVSRYWACCWRSGAGDLGGNWSGTVTSRKTTN